MTADIGSDVIPGVWRDGSPVCELGGKKRCGELAAARLRFACGCMVLRCEWHAEKTWDQLDLALRRLKPGQLAQCGQCLNLLMWFGDALWDLITEVPL